MENGFMNKIIGLVLVLVIGATLVGGLLAPTVEGIQTTVGDPVTKNNTSAEWTLDPIQGGTTIQSLDGALTINDTVLTLQDRWITLAILDTAYMEFKPNVGSNPSLRVIHFDDASAVTTFTGNFTVTINNGSYSVSGNTTLEGEYTKGYVANATNTGKYVIQWSSNLANSYYSKTPLWVITADWAELDEFLYYDGVLKQIGDDVIEITISNPTLAEGTTDIYTGSTITTTVNGTETTKNMRVLLPASIEGHKDSGMFYVMFGVITLLAIIMLVTVAAAAIRSKY